MEEDTLANSLLIKMKYHWNYVGLTGDNLHLFPLSYSSSNLPET